MHKARGFTLLEMLVVLVLIGILAAVSVPSIARSFSAHSVDREARKIHTQLVDARAQAVATQRPHRFKLASDGTFQVEYDNGVTWVLDEAVRELSTGVSISIDGASSGEILFQTHGRVEDPAVVKIEDSEHERKILVLAAGLVRWESRGK